ESALALERIAIDENDPAAAELAARKFQAQFHREQQSDDELAASTVLIKALLAEGKNSDAQLEADRNQSLASRNQNLIVQLQFKIQSALVLIASGHFDMAHSTLQQLLLEARSHGFVGVEFEARLALAQLEKASHHQAAADESFKSLDRSAHARGFGLIARK